jgi:hypothetical protein
LTTSVALPRIRQDAELGVVVGHRTQVRTLAFAGLIAVATACSATGSSLAPEGQEAFFGVANETTSDAVVRLVGEKDSLNLLIPAGTLTRLPDPDPKTFGAVVAAHILAPDCHVALASFLDAMGWNLGGRWTITSSGIEPSFTPAEAGWPIATATAACEGQPVPRLTPPPAA